MLSLQEAETVFLEEVQFHIPTNHQHAGVVTVLDSGHSTVCGSKYFTVVFISSVMCDIEHIFMYFFENLHIFFGELSFALFLIWLFIFLLLHFEFFVYFD